MIVSCRDKRTRDFAAEKRVKAFSRFERPERLKLDRLEATASLHDGSESISIPSHLATASQEETTYRTPCPLRVGRTVISTS
jgi:hypothetical protein